LTVSNTLRYIFLLHFIVGIILGFLFFLSPEFYVDLTGWPWIDHAAGRVMGSCFIGFSVAALLGYRAESWAEVKIIVLANVTWCLFATISMVWMMAVYPALPIMAAGLNLFLVALFFILYLYAYYTH
jgi:hypothetical protein